MAPLWSDFKPLLPNYWQHIINLMMMVPVYSATSYIQYNSWMSWEWIVLQFGQWLTAEEIIHQCLNSNERTWKRGSAKTESATIHNKTFSLKNSDDCSLKGLLCMRRDYIPFCHWNWSWVNCCNDQEQHQNSAWPSHALPCWSPIWMIDHCYLCVSETNLNSFPFGSFYKSVSMF